VNRRRNDDEDGIVWSSDPGAKTPSPARKGSPSPTPPAGTGVVRVVRQSKGRRGKTVTVITGVPLTAAGLDDLARDLKKRCGTGGTVRGDVVEIQGDQRDVVVAELERRGWAVK
jgi:translation initiation factor 1